MNRFIPVATVAVAMAASLPAMAQQKLRVADSLPVGHFFAESGTKFWMAEVKRLTNGKVDFEYFPSEQLGKAKDMLTLTQTGVADVGYVVPSYVSEKMPLSAWPNCPAAFPPAARARWPITGCRPATASWPSANSPPTTCA